MNRKRQQLSMCVAVFSFAGLFSSCTSLYSTPPASPASDQSIAGADAAPRYQFVKADYNGTVLEYWSAEQCADCHAEIYQTWIASSHARSMNSLAPEEQALRNCIRCHAPASQNVRSDALTGVQCEDCHGVGCPEFVLRTNPECSICELKTACFRCHTARRSPGFILDDALQTVKDNQH